MKAKGFSTWIGNWKEGSGTIATEGDTVPATPYSYASRFGHAAGASPEELLAAAHAGCFNQALANNFGMNGLTAEIIRTSVTIEMGEDVDGRPAIIASHITVEAKAGGMDRAQFDHCAERAKTNCSIAKVLRCRIDMTAKMLS